MHERERVKLIGGPYRTPRCKVGRFLRCAMRGPVRVRGIHEAPIQWPYTLRKNGGRPMLILCGDLARAVRVESETAICHWWGVGVTTVWKWRKALGVESVNDGTSALLSRWAPETVQSDEAARQLADVQGSPERAAKIAAAKRGKPRPESVRAALRKANLGRKASAKQRWKMSERHPLSKDDHELGADGTGTFRPLFPFRCFIGARRHAGRRARQSAFLMKTRNAQRCLSRMRWP